MNYPSSPARRVLVIGLDGATYDLLVPWAASGFMPNLAQLMARSSMSVVNSTQPCITPVAWTTFQTGCDPAEHGILDYRYLDHRCRRLGLNHAGRSRCPTLFEAVSHAGDEVVSLNLPMTSPAPATVRGIVVGGLDSPSIEAALAPYPAFAENLRATGVRYDLSTVWRRKPTEFDELAANVAATAASFRGQAVAALIADQMTDWKLMVVQLQVLDAFQHRCWHLLCGDGDGAPRAWVAKAREALRAMDDCLGELITLAERRRSAVVAVSDHGFGPFREKITLAEILSRRGLLKLPGWSGAASYYVRRGGWKLRKLVWRRLRPGCSTAQLTRPLDSLLAIDWKRSSALALHGNLGGLIYLNTPDRFGGGPLATPRLRDQALAEVAAAFDEARHPETGERLFVDVFGTAERFGLDPVEAMWPDVLAIPAPGFHTRHKFDAAPQLLRNDPTLTATHRLEGVLMVQAPGVVSGNAPTAELRDVAPTILHLLGVPAPARMSGRILTEIFADCSPATACEAHGRRGMLEPAGITDADQRSVEARLRDLGYLD
ncbi:MAG TPA: alkaline phosphatase family protein [Pirellulales bacterium]|jgi:predicted AlkP superfamily phosphohydrolase/phosphomutase|nr:alkaline phosphatase family protein [Pirellulales bacterium]